LKLLFEGPNMERTVYLNYVQNFISYLKENTVRVH